MRIAQTNQFHFLFRSTLNLTPKSLMFVPRDGSLPLRFVVDSASFDCRLWFRHNNVCVNHLLYIIIWTEQGLDLFFWIPHKGGRLIMGKEMWDQGSLVAWVVVEEFVPWSDDACVCEWDILHHHHQDTVETWLVCYRNLVGNYFGPYS